jgi:DNA-binding transcriptional MerR regulator
MREAQAARYASKSDTAFRTIGEVVQELDLPAHVLRFWESKFPEVKPMKRGGGRRYYRPEDLDLLRRIRHHLYHQGYTIRGVQKLLSQGGLGGDPSPPGVKARLKVAALETVARSTETAVGPNLTLPELQRALKEVRAELLQIRRLLDKLLAR